MKHYRTNPENAFADACKNVQTAANVSQNWLRGSYPQLVQLLHAESGCMRSTRLAVLEPVTHEVTSRSLLQIVTLPAAFDAPGCHGYHHPRWQLFVYSWVGRRLTLRLMDHLRQNDVDLSEARFFLVTAQGCECLSL